MSLWYKFLIIRENEFLRTRENEFMLESYMVKYIYIVLLNHT